MHGCVQASSPPEPARLERLRRWLDVAIAHTPSVVHDGSAVLFVSDATGLPLAYRVPTLGGTPSVILASGERTDRARASPAGPRAIVATDAGGNEHWQLALVDLVDSGRPPPARWLTNAPKVIHMPGAWRPDGKRFLYASNERDPRYFDVYDRDVDSDRPPRRIWQDDSFSAVTDVRRDQVLIARANTNLDIDLFEIGPAAPVHLNPHPGEVTVLSATLGADGVYAGANPGRELCALVRFRHGRAGHEFLREYPGDVEIVASDGEGQRLALAINRDGLSELHIYEIETNEDRRIPTSPRGVIGALEWFPSTPEIAYDLSSPDGQEVYRVDAETGRSRRLTRSPSPPPVATREPRLGRSRSSDGVDVPYWEYLPSTGTPKGTILNVHGGPEGQARPQFAAPTQFLVAEGFRVVLPNVRGSTGYGRTFAHLDDVRRRMDSVRDLSELVARLVRDGKAEPGRIGVMGGSYGGFIVLSSISTYPDLFQAAVCLVGISNFVTFLENTGPWRRRLREAEYGSLEHDREFLESISPIGHADRIRAPLLVIHGRNDPRVPFGEAEQIVGTLSSLGRTVELIVFDDEGHGVVRRPNRLVAWARAAEFFERHLAGPAAPGPSGAPDA
jgi:dipeptidyl aminopeptidase/acylaminoacyl peptidase